MLWFHLRSSILRAFLLAVFCFFPIEAWAVDYHVKAAQDFQNALTLAAASSVSNNIYLTNGYYLGNFNYNSTNVNSITILAEAGVTNTLITVDGGGTGSSLNISASGSPFVTVQGITFLRNCSSTSIGALQIAGGNTTILVNGCQFLSPSNSTGIGLLINAGVNAMVTNCVATGISGGGVGSGVSITGVITNVTVQNCTITLNGSVGSIYNNFASPGILIIGANNIYVTGCLFGSNSNSATGYYNAGYSGGGLYCKGTSANVTGNSFINNASSGSGAGGFFQLDSLLLIGNLFEGNGNSGSGYTQGGAIYTSATSVLAANNIFAGNIGNYGGAISSYAILSTLSNNVFAGNIAISGTGGGGALLYGGCQVVNNAFRSNSVSGMYPGGGQYNYGGGIYCISYDTNIIQILGNSFQQNIADFGGGIYATGPNVIVQDNLVYNNVVGTTASRGGGIWVNPTSSLNMVNNTIYGNSSLGNGGGVALIVSGTSELLNVYNNIIWGNTATVSGGDVWLSGTGQKKIFSNNDADNLYGVWDLAQNNIDLSPKFFDPVNCDFHIQTTSPCRSVGTTTAPSLPSTDLEGNPRIVNGLVDIGCYQFTTTVPHPADTNKDFVISAAEFNAYSAAWKSGQSWVTGPSPILAEYLTRAGYLMTNGGTYHNDGSARPVNWKIGH